MYWSDDRIAEIRELWARDISASEIAALMATSRDAVIAKARRLGLPARAASTLEERFERCIDLMTDADLNAPVSLQQAARIAGAAYIFVESRWAAICERLGESPMGGDEVVRPL